MRGIVIAVPFSLMLWGAILWPTFRGLAYAALFVGLVGGIIVISLCWRHR
jgi:hypothetical protein